MTDAAAPKPGRTGPAWRTHQKVRAGSRRADEAYDFCQPIDREEKIRRLTAFDAYAERQRVRRRENKAWGPKGPLGFSAVALGRLLIRFMAEVTRSGRRVLAPSRAYLADKLGLDLKTIDRAKAELRAHGWLTWMRRVEPVDEPGGEGPQVRQIPNAYRLLLPAAAAVLLGFRGMPAPVSADLATQAEQAAASEAGRRSHARDRFAARLEASPQVQRAMAKIAGDKLRMSAKDISPRNRPDEN